MEVLRLNKFLVEYFGHNGEVLGFNEFEAENIDFAKGLVEDEIGENSIIYVNSVEKENLDISIVGICTSAISKFYLG